MLSFVQKKNQKRFGINDQTLRVEWQVSHKNLKYDGPCGICMTIKESTPLKTKTLTVCRVLRPNERMKYAPKLQFFERLCSHMFLLETFGCFGAPAFVRIPVLIEKYDPAYIHAIQLPSPTSEDWIDIKRVSNDAQSLTMEVSEPCGLFALIFRPTYHDIRVTAVGGLFHFSTIPYAQLRIPKLSCKGEHSCRLTMIPIHPTRERFCREKFPSVRQIEYLSPFYYFHCTGKFTKENTVTLPLPDWATDENTNVKMDSLIVVNKTDDNQKWEMIDSPLTTTKCTISFKLKNLGLLCIFPRPNGVMREQLALEAIRRSFDMLIDNMHGYYRLNPAKRRMLQLWMGYLPSYVEEEMHHGNLDAGYLILPRNKETDTRRKSLIDQTSISSGPKGGLNAKKGAMKKTDAEIIKHTFDRRLLNGSMIIFSLTGDFEFFNKDIRPPANAGRQQIKKTFMKKKRTESDWPFDVIDRKGGCRFESDVGDTMREKMVPISEYLPDCYRSLDVQLRSGAEEAVSTELSKVLARYCLGAALGNPSSPVQKNLNFQRVNSDGKKGKPETSRTDSVISQFDFQNSNGFEGLVICSVCTSTGEYINIDFFQFSLPFVDALNLFNIDPQRELMKMQPGFSEPSAGVTKKEFQSGFDEESDDESMGNPAPEGRALSIKSLQAMSECFCHGLQLGRDLNIKGMTLCSIAFWTLALPLRIEETNLRILKAWKNGCLEHFKKRKDMETDIITAFEKNNRVELARILKKCMNFNRPVLKRQLKDIKRIM